MPASTPPASRSTWRWPVNPGGLLSIDITNPIRRDGGGRPAAPGTGTGLIGLAERVGLAGGRLDHETNAAGQFRLRARLPWPA